MIYVAHIEGGIVAQVTVDPDDFEPGQGHVVVGPENTVGIGWTYDGQFSPPPVEAEA